VDFQSYAERKARAAEHAVIAPLVTIDDRSSGYPRQHILGIDFVFGGTSLIAMALAARHA